MDLQLRGHIAWVLGASSGLGYAIAAALLGEGCRVAISARPGDRLDAATASLEAVAGAHDTDVISVAADVTDPDGLAAAHRRVTAELGRVQIGIMNGGGPSPAGVLELSPSQLDEAYHLLLRPAVQFLGLVGAPMAESDGGVVLFCTSSGAREPIARLAPSNIMRAGVTALMKSAATELGARGVRVLALAPGRIGTARTEQLDRFTAERTGRDIADVQSASASTIPIGRYGEPDEFGAVAAFLCSPAASYMSGTTVVVDGGKLQGLLT